MINFAKYFPDLFTHSVSPIVTSTTLATLENSENENILQHQQPENGSPAVDAIAVGVKAAGGNLNRAQKKKKKRAALVAVSSKAMGESLRMDESIADPGNWPALSLIANSQLRLFITRCDPFSEVAIDADR